MKTNQSLLEAIEFLEKKGFVDRFIWTGTALKLKGSWKVYFTEDCIIRSQIKISNIPVEGINGIMAIMINDGTKGLLVNERGQLMDTLPKALFGRLNQEVFKNE